MKQLFIFTEPPDADVQLIHDKGFTLTPHPGDVQGRPARVFDIPEDTPNGWGTRLIISKKDFVTLEQRGILFLDGPAARFQADDFYLRPFERRALPELVVRGKFFGLKSGERITLIGASRFALYERLLRGEDIEPTLKQSQELGYNCQRVWSRYESIAGIGSLRLEDFPELYDQLPNLVKICAKFGQYVELTAYLGAPSMYDLEHWPRLYETLKGYPVLMDFVNENGAQHDRANVMNTDPFSPSPYHLCSHGSNGSQAWPIEPYWQFSTFHTNDAPQWQRKVGHNGWEIPGCVYADENTRYPDHDQSLEHAYDAARAAAYFIGGSVYHSVSGKLGREFALGVELDAARSWADGAKSANLEFQGAQYSHHAELEGPNAGDTGERVYGFKLPDGREEIVHIHGA